MRYISEIKCIVLMYLVSSNQGTTKVMALLELRVVQRHCCSLSTDSQVSVGCCRGHSSSTSSLAWSSLLFLSTGSAAVAGSMDSVVRAMPQPGRSSSSLISSHQLVVESASTSYREWAEATVRCLSIAGSSNHWLCLSLIDCHFVGTWTVSNCPSSWGFQLGTRVC